HSCVNTVAPLIGVGRAEPPHAAIPTAHRVTRRTAAWRMGPQRTAGRGLTAVGGAGFLWRRPGRGKPPQLSRRHHMPSGTDGERTTGGLVGKVAGKVKEAIGSATSNEDLEREGRLQD